MRQEKINGNIPLYSKNETKSTAALFEARKFYQEQTLKFVNTEYFNEVLLKTNLKKLPFGDLYRNNALYGVVDHLGNSIIPKVDESYFTVINSVDGKAIRLQDFVTDAFMDMRNYLKRQIVKNSFTKESVYSNIVVRKGYQDFNGVYTSHINIIANKFKSYVLKNKDIDSKISDHKKFSEEYIKFITQHFSISPFTKSSTAIAYNFEIFSSGLMFTINEDDFGDDVNKYISYFLDEGFFCFAEACQRFGFVMDKNIPFLLYADLGSPAMKRYLNRYGFNDAKDLFNKRFDRLYLKDVEFLKSSFINSYSAFLVNNLEYSESLNNLCVGDVNKVNKKYRTPVDYNVFIKDLPDSYWVSLYVYFKNLETKRGLKQNEYDNLVKVANDLYRYGKTSKALKLISGKFNISDNVYYFDTLLRNLSVVQQDKQFGSSAMPPVIFRG